ncbi:MAG: methyltransferase domain-containing protein [Sulfurospirillum sp.]|nr:methyltransferase domain-containing protein [Sulfurospirillum sp.]
MDCKICNSPTTSFEDLKFQTLYHHCTNCQYIFLDPSYILEHDDEKSQYDFHNNSLQDAGYVQFLENFLHFFWEDVRKTSKNALDFGSGPGPVLDTLIKRRGVPCDIYDKFYQQEQIFVGKSYDLITSTEVFEHLSEPKETLLLLTKHLHVGSHLALMSLFHNNNEADFLQWWYRRDPTHIGFFTPKTVEVLALTCGMRLLKHDNKRIALLTLA